MGPFLLVSFISPACSRVLPLYLRHRCNRSIHSVRWRMPINMCRAGGSSRRHALPGAFWFDTWSPYADVRRFGGCWSHQKKQVHGRGSFGCYHSLFHPVHHWCICGFLDFGLCLELCFYCQRPKPCPSLLARGHTCLRGRVYWVEFVHLFKFVLFFFKLFIILSNVVRRQGL